jgi:hypothetical protein
MCPWTRWVSVTIGFRLLPVFGFFLLWNWLHDLGLLSDGEDEDDVPVGEVGFGYYRFSVTFGFRLLLLTTACGVGGGATFRNP